MVVLWQQKITKIFERAADRMPTPFDFWALEDLSFKIEKAMPSGSHIAFEEVSFAGGIARGADSWPAKFILTALGKTINMSI